MYRYEKIVQIICEVIDGMNDSSGADRTRDESPATVLIGSAGILDSLRFINFVVSVEQNIAREFHAPISIMDAIVTSERPEWTVAALAQSIAVLLGPPAGEDGRPEGSVRNELVACTPEARRD